MGGFVSVPAHVRRRVRTGRLVWPGFPAFTRIYVMNPQVCAVDPAHDVVSSDVLWSDGDFGIFGTAPRRAATQTQGCAFHGFWHSDGSCPHFLLGSVDYALHVTGRG